MQVLWQGATTSHCKNSNWSAFAAVQTPKRNRLSSRTLNDLVYLRVNPRLQQKRIDTNYQEKVAEWIEAEAVADDIDVVDYDIAEEDAAVLADVVVVDVATATTATTTDAVAAIAAS
jgi:broad-specificity NMP kinase